MRFSAIFATSALLLASFSTACQSDVDCPRGEICCFLSTVDSQGTCFGRGLVPPHCMHTGRKASGGSKKKGRSLPRAVAARKVIEAELIAREAEMEWDA